MNANKTFHEVSHSLVHKYQVKEQLNLTAKKLGKAYCILSAAYLILGFVWWDGSNDFPSFVYCLILSLIHFLLFDDIGIHYDSEEKLKGKIYGDSTKPRLTSKRDIIACLFNIFTAELFEIMVLMQLYTWYMFQTDVFYNSYIWLDNEVIQNSYTLFFLLTLSSVSTICLILYNIFLLKLELEIYGMESESEEKKCLLKKPHGFNKDQENSFKN